MATDDSSILVPKPLETNSYDTALCIIPPPELCHNIDRLRALYDKSYGKWPPHINLVYPFVAPENLSQARQRLLQDVKSGPILQSSSVILNRSGYFEHKHNHTVYVCESNEQAGTPLVQLRSLVLEALGQHSKPCQLHLTIGQSEDSTESARDLILDKARLLPEISFPIERLAILVRERNIDRPKQYRMRLWNTIDVTQNAASPMSEFWLKDVFYPLDGANNLEDTEETGTARMQPEITYHFDWASEIWISMRLQSPKEPNPESVTIASYNVLLHTGYLPVQDRDPLLVNIILSPPAIADILVLQEVSDTFLSYLLADPEVRKRYPFTSNGPPSQPDIGPLPNLRNIVILSKWPFSWASLPFRRRHKGAVIAQFDNVQKPNSSTSIPLVVAGVHLTCGLTDGAVAAKSVQLQNLKNYLVKEFPSNPWVIAGDFNITTSTQTIQIAVKNGSISPHTVETLRRVEEMMEDGDLIDTWKVVKPEDIPGVVQLLKQDAVYTGESGATFSPLQNELAATTSGTSNNRPQRYDRILVKPEGFIGIQNFNVFGIPKTDSGDATQLASDHWGVRALLNIYKNEEVSLLEEYGVDIEKAPRNLSDDSDLRSCLSNHGMLPSEAEVNARAEAFSLIKTVLLGSTVDEDTISSDIPMVIVPVGSYALNVWTSSSDIDCLCIGSTSSKTFFQLARQRILKHSNQGIRLLRKVEANTGTMFVLSVNGIRMDLQYCPAARIVERWTTLSEFPDSDPIYNLPMLSLRKLKPFRDLLYIQNTVPNMEAFRLAYRCIKLWATQRGVYSSKFGYLGGIHITLMLSWICKRMAHQTGAVTAADVITTFFSHYADFNWKDDMVFDAFFHRKRPRYQRSAREPMVILGFHAPNSNIAHTSTTPALKTLIREFRLANEKLSSDGMTWDEFFGSPGADPSACSLTIGARDFLTSHDSYVKIDLQHWGRRLNKATSFLGWLESRCLFLVVDIHKAVPNLNIQMFPARFAVSESVYVHGDYHGCYLIGLSKQEGIELMLSKEDQQAMKTKLNITVDSFVNQIHLDGKNFDSSTTWVEVSVVSRKAVKELALDSRDWGEYAVEDDEDEDDDDCQDSGDGEEEQLLPSAVKKLSVRPSGASSEPVSTNKLRPASDVLNRLRWDPNLDPNDYIVGYEDRFTGAKEMNLERWKTEQTDEEFIPQHRILYFKRRSDGTVVWERRRRIDVMFGSGAGQGGGEL
jgi:uncharacterized protein (UPF0248 family)/endonuclease/exonuclease/phosphatase family metal-dependent hydrolase